MKEEMRIDENEEFHGALPPITILNERYPSEIIDFTPIIFEKQLVIAGILCHSLWVDPEGVCMFDRSIDMQRRPPPALVSTSHTREARDRTHSIVWEEGDDEETCSLCKFMKAGPCRKEFIPWDAAVNSDDLTANQDLLLVSHLGFPSTTVRSHHPCRDPSSPLSALPARFCLTFFFVTAVIKIVCSAHTY